MPKTGCFSNTYSRFLIGMDKDNNNLYKNILTEKTSYNASNKDI